LAVGGSYTTILIAHRMSTVRSCDIIFELENGKITGSGTYDGLLKSSACSGDDRGPLKFIAN